MYPFEYTAPTLLSEALGALARHGPETRFLAGGTDLMIAIRERGLKPSCLVDLKRIGGLSDITRHDGRIRIGGLASVRSLERSALIREQLPALSAAAAMLASVQVRNKATIGGNICNASPAADLAPPLLVLDAVAIVVGPAGERRIPIAELFAGPGRTHLNGDILTAFEVPIMPAGARATYVKHGPRSAMDIAIVGAAALVVPDASGKRVAEVRIALGSVAPTPIRAWAAEATLRGAPIDPEMIQQGARVAAQEDACPIADVRGSAEYRRAMVAAMTRRALQDVTA